MTHTRDRAAEGPGPPHGPDEAPAAVAGPGATARWLAALAGGIGGAAAQLTQGRLWPVAAHAALGLLALMLLLVMRRFGRRAPGWALGLALLAGASTGAAWTGLRAAAHLAQALPPALEGRDLRVSGTVSQMPQRSEGALRFQFAVEDAQWAQPDAPAEAPPAVPPRLALSWYAPGSGLWAPEPREPAPAALPALHAGERWTFTVRLRAPHGSRNPHGFDAELWLWEQGVQATGHVRTGARDAPPRRLGAGWRHPVERAREAVRDAILAQAGDVDGDDTRRRAAGVVAALVTGDQAAIGRADWDLFRATGVAHLMAISGLHVTMFAWLAAAVVGALWRRSTRALRRGAAQQAALVGGVLLAAAYALFSGWGVPAQRTVCMLAIVALLRGGGRHWPWPCVWLLACAAVVALDPWALLQPGFWLSFVAVGVLFASDAGLAARLHDAQPGAVRQLGRRVGRLLREQWVVTLAITPLSLLLFHQVSLVGYLANLVAIPWVTLLVTPLAMLGVLLPPLWTWAAVAVQALGLLLHWLAGWPHATWHGAAAPLWAGAAGVLGGLLLVMRLPAPLRLMGVPLLLPVLLWQPPRPAHGDFDLLAADVGQGNAVLLRTARHSLLYDAGPRYGPDSDAGQRVLAPLLRALGEQPHTVLLSHRDSDHTGGAAAVLMQHPRARLLGSIEAGHPLQALRPATRCEAGQRWEWDGVRFELLHPRAEDYRRFTARPNALSCVLRVDNGRVAVLLAGDIERAQEAALVARSGAGLRADLLLVPHHGSKSSSSAPLLDAVVPRVAVVQSGWRNRFGHPAPEVTARLRERGIAVVDSPHCGAARWHSARPERVHCERIDAPRYWQHSPPPAP